MQSPYQTLKELIVEYQRWYGLKGIDQTIDWMVEDLRHIKADQRVLKLPLSKG